MGMQMPPSGPNMSPLGYQTHGMPPNVSEPIWHKRFLSEFVVFQLIRLLNEFNDFLCKGILASCYQIRFHHIEFAAICIMHHTACFTHQQNTRSYVPRL